MLQATLQINPLEHKNKEHIAYTLYLLRSRSLFEFFVDLNRWAKENNFTFGKKDSHLCPKCNNNTSQDELYNFDGICENCFTTQQDAQVEYESLVREMGEC